MTDWISMASIEAMKIENVEKKAEIAELKEHINEITTYSKETLAIIKADAIEKMVKDINGNTRFDFISTDNIETYAQQLREGE
jgi:hypothetical protein